MQVLLDHLAATLVGSAVLVVLLAVTLGGRSEAVDQTRYDIHREWARTLASLLEDDLRNVGSGVPPTEAALVEAGPGAITLRLKDGFGTAPVKTVRYASVPTDPVEVGGALVPTWALERSEDGVVVQRFEGLTEVAFELRDRDGAPTTDLAAGRAVHVRFAFGAGPTSATGTDPRARYRRAVQMPNLAGP